MKNKLLAITAAGLIVFLVLGRFDFVSIYSVTYLPEKPRYYKTNILSGSTQVCQFDKSKERGLNVNGYSYVAGFNAMCYPLPETLITKD